MGGQFGHYGENNRLQESTAFSGTIIQAWTLSGNSCGALRRYKPRKTGNQSSAMRVLIQHATISTPATVASAPGGQYLQMYCGRNCSLS